ncbi:hypothetical protein OIU78_027763 [Salix suchowensis]|nr:hypothetical protein OIU78_027763 [Salix suchowensis]
MRDLPLKKANESVVAFGPPGLKHLEGPKEEGEAVVRTITGSHPDMKGTLTESSLREDSTRQVNYYKLESPTISAA